MKKSCQAEFRFYAELNDFLALPQRGQAVCYRFSGHPGIKDPIEAIGIPHTEVDLIVVNGTPVGFDYPLQTNDRVAVYPVFNHLDLSPLPKLREERGESPAFVIDVNLGKLARGMRLLGFDALYRNDYRDSDVVDIAASQGRAVLTRDRRLLFARRITYGYWVRSVEPGQQISEVLARFRLHPRIRPFFRCLRCNGILEPATKADVLEQLEPKTKRYYEDFLRCSDCGQVYWEGSHMDGLRQWCKTFQQEIRLSTDAPP